jgi:hypothetical protein
MIGPLAFGVFIAQKSLFLHRGDKFVRRQKARPMDHA